MRCQEAPWAVVAVLILLCACAGADNNKKTDLRVAQVWARHEKAFEAAVKGRREEYQFAQASLFFQKLTGIKLHINIASGFTLQPGSERDLVLIREWYEKNKHQLYWDDSTKSVRGACSPGDSSRRQALREWARQEKVIEGALKGEHDLDDVLEAAVFFEELTGISIRGDGTTLGFLISPQAGEDLAKIRHWCEANCSRLCWYDPSNTVSLAPALP